MIKPLIRKAMKKQNLKFFLDSRDYHDKNNIQVRVMYGKGYLNFRDRLVARVKNKCCISLTGNRKPVYETVKLTAAEQNQSL
jgi:hypothetical protein